MPLHDEATVVPTFAAVDAAASARIRERATFSRQHGQRQRSGASDWERGYGQDGARNEQPSGARAGVEENSRFSHLVMAPRSPFPVEADVHIGCGRHAAREMVRLIYLGSGPVRRHGRGRLSTGSPRPSRSGAVAQYELHYALGPTRRATANQGASNRMVAEAYASRQKNRPSVDVQPCCCTGSLVPVRDAPPGYQARSIRGNDRPSIPRCGRWTPPLFPFGWRRYVPPAAGNAAIGPSRFSCWKTESRSTAQDVHFPPSPSPVTVGCLGQRPTVSSPARTVRIGPRGTAVDYPAHCQPSSAPSLLRRLEAPRYPRDAAPPSHLLPSVTQTGYSRPAGGRGGSTIRDGEGGRVDGKMASSCRPARNRWRAFKWHGQCGACWLATPRAPGGLGRNGRWSRRTVPAALQPESRRRGSGTRCRGERGSGSLALLGTPCCLLQHRGDGTSSHHSATRLDQRPPPPRSNATEPSSEACGEPQDSDLTI